MISSKSIHTCSSRHVAMTMNKISNSSISLTPPPVLCSQLLPPAAHNPAITDLLSVSRFYFFYFSMLIVKIILAFYTNGITKHGMLSLFN